MVAERAMRLQRIGAAMLVGLGVGHLGIITVLKGATMLSWISAGLWAAVPLFSPGGPTEAALQNAVVFWAGAGSFSVPAILLGLLLWGFARRGIAPGAWLGWGLIAWFAVLTVLLVPSPAIVGVGAGVLLVLAARPSNGGEARMT